MNFSQLPLDTRRLIVAHLKGDLQKKSIIVLTGEVARWVELSDQLKHTILNGPGGDTVLSIARAWVLARCLEAGRALDFWAKFEPLEKLLLKCKIAPV